MGLVFVLVGKVVFQAPQKIMPLFLAFAVLMFSKRFVTTRGVMMTGRGSGMGMGMGFVFAVATVTAISKSFKITSFHIIRRTGVNGEALDSHMRVGKCEVSAIYGVRHGVTGMVVGMVVTMTVLVRLSVSALDTRGSRLGINGSREAEKASVSNEGLGDHCRLKYE